MDRLIHAKAKIVVVVKEVSRMRKIYVFAVCALLIGALLPAANGFGADPKINLQALVAKRMPVLLEFGRGWCIPCKYMKPILEDMAAAYRGKAIVLPVDMDANKDLVRSFRIRMMPTQVFLTADGKEFIRNEGTLEREQIMQVFAKMGVPPPQRMATPAQRTAPAQTPPGMAPPAVKQHPGPR
jgi:thioredoxin-like negative regulator of GroEL